MATQQTTSLNSALGMCPNCEAQIPFNSSHCPKCHAEFGGGNLWKIKPLPPHTMAMDVKEQLARAERYRDQRNWLMLAFIAVAVVVGVVLAIANHSGGRSIVMLLVFVSATVAFALSKRQKPAQCPKCGYKWLYKEDRKDLVPPDYPQAELTDWQACPGCGLAMK